MLDPQELRVLQIAATLDRRMGGPTSVVINSSEYLRSQFKSNLLVFGSNNLIQDALEIPTLFNNRYGVPATLLSRSTLKKIKSSDLLLIHGFYLFSTLLALAIGKQAQVVVMPHGSLEEYQQRHGRIRKKIFDWCIFQLLSGRELNFFVASNSEARQVKRRFSTAKVVVVGLGANFDQEKAIKRELRAPINLLSFSRIASKKRIDLIIRATRTLIDLGYTCELDIYGDGESSLIFELMELVNELNLGSFVKFYGHTEGSQIIEAFNKATIFVLPSENENFAVAVAEAISYGIPTIVSRFVAMHEFVSLHETGVVISHLEVDEIAAAVVEIVKNYDKFTVACLNSASLLSWANIMPRWERGILEIFESRKSK